MDDHGNRPARRARRAPRGALAVALVLTGVAAAGASAWLSARPAGKVVLRPDGLGVAAFGAAEREAVQALRRALGPWAERGSWPDGQTAFGTCTGGVRALRWGRLYVLFTNGPTPHGREGTWHLFAYQATTWKVFPVAPTGPPPRLTGPSPRTPEGVGLGATVSRLRAVYGKRLELWGGPEGGGPGFQVTGGDPLGLHGGLTNASPAGRVIALAAGAGCGD